MGVSRTPSLQGDGTHVFGPFQRLLLGIVFGIPNKRSTELQGGAIELLPTEGPKEWNNTQHTKKLKLL